MSSDGPSKVTELYRGAWRPCSHNSLFVAAMLARLAGCHLSTLTACLRKGGKDLWNCTTVERNTYLTQRCYDLQAGGKFEEMKGNVREHTLGAFDDQVTYVPIVLTAFVVPGPPNFCPVTK